MPRSLWAGQALGLIAVLVTAAAAFGLSTRRLDLNLGPGDSPFVSGFEPNNDVENKVGWHWTTYDAQVELPFVAAGSDVELTLRYARMFGEEAVVNVQVGGVPTEPFKARGGEIRTTTLLASGVSGPLVVGVTVDSHERRNMGLRMDRLSIDVPSGPPLRLRLGAALIPVTATALLFAGLLALGASPAPAGGLALIAALGFAAQASVNLFQAWRQVSLAPQMLVASTVFLFVGRRWLERRMSIERDVSTILVSAALLTMLFRLGLVSHPDFYYPDLLTHTRVADAIRNEGPSFFLHPADALNAQGAWTKPVLGGVSSLPYAILFHTPFAILAFVFDLSIDQMETVMKAASCLISVLPILLAAALATRLGLPPLAALLLCVIPTYASRLSFALLPALLGHVFDLIALLSVAVALGADGLKSRRSVVWVVSALLAGHLAYTSSVVNESLFVAVLALLYLCTVRRGALVTLRMGFAEGMAALCAFGLYYRHFVGDVFGLAGRLLGSGSGAPFAPLASSVYPIEGFWSLLVERTQTFFGWPYVGLAFLGLGLAGASVLKSRILPAWVLTYLLLIFLRAKIPDVFRYGHETLFLTPLVAVLAGAALVLTYRRGGVLRLASVGSGLVLFGVSLWEQWLSVSDQLGNAS
ncbi:MAG: hypothetical protein JJE39_11340 [Vicinamibacteria bacterium]|nr:hypothetical protein [Vicinamibacteria bacterium]